MVTKTIPSNALIEELLRDAELAEEPGDIHENDVVHRPDSVIPTPMITTAMVSAGYIYIYDTVTHEQSITNRNMLVSQLEKKRPDGTRVFTTVRPKEPPKRGTLKCYLHKDQPERAHYDAIGLAVCSKSNLPSQYMVEQHMEHKHRVEWATISAERAAQEKAEDRAFQRALMARVGTEGASPRAAEKPPTPRRKRVPKAKKAQPQEQPNA